MSGLAPLVRVVPTNLPSAVDRLYAGSGLGVAPEPLVPGRVERSERPYLRR